MIQKTVTKIKDHWKKIWDKLKNKYWRAKCRYIRFYDSLPIDDRMILMEAEQGRTINGNIYYIAKYLAQTPKYEHFKLYLSARGGNVKRFQKVLAFNNVENVEVVSLSSDQYFRVLASAKYLITDTSFLPFFVKKEGQIYLNTWHGTPLKSLGKNIQTGPHGIGNGQRNFVCSDFLLFPNEYTRDHIIEDYMLANISKSRCVLSGYPRNEVFFDDKRRMQIREDLELTGKRIYAYMPTFRGGVRTGTTQKSDAYMTYYLCELDKQLADNEVLYVNLHPIVIKSGIDFRQFQHIRKFPENYETYEFLNVADVLVTDYSSVFFDFAGTGRKIILFPYDKEEYLADRGMYFSMDELPFPQVRSERELLQELRSEKIYDDREFIQKFAPYEGLGATQRLCDYTILGEDTGLKVEEMPNNGKENVLLYVGNLAGNGITASVRALFDTIDLGKRNYYITFITETVQPYYKTLFALPKEVSFYPTTGDLNLTIANRVVRKLFKWKVIPAPLYVKLLGKRIRQDYERNFGCAKFDTVIQFNGYEQEVILRLSAAPCRKVIFVHSDMLAEIKIRKNQRRDVLRYAYRHYDKVAAVTEGILTPTYKIAGRKDNICIVKNAIQYQSILERAQEEITLDDFTRCSLEREEFFELMGTPCPKFICVGRFSPEKGHRRLVDAFHNQLANMPDAKLIIMGGSSYGSTYDELQEYILSLGLEKSVVLLRRVSNPYPIIKACDYSILSSFYEGFGLVLVEADILGKPVVSTDIPGPRDFMLAHGGILVENSQKGLEHGLQMLACGEVQPMSVDYQAYNQSVVKEFEQLL